MDGPRLVPRKANNVAMALSMSVSLFLATCRTKSVRSRKMMRSFGSPVRDIPLNEVLSTYQRINVTDCSKGQCNVHSGFDYSFNIMCYLFTSHIREMRICNIFQEGGRESKSCQVSRLTDDGRIRTCDLN